MVLLHSSGVAIAQTAPQKKKGPDSKRAGGKDQAGEENSSAFDRLPESERQTDPSDRPRVRDAGSEG